MIIDSQIPEEISLLITDFLKGVIDNDGLSTLKKWLEEDELHLEQFNNLKSAWIMSNTPIAYSPEKIESELAHLKDTLGKSDKPKVFWTFSKIAASWIVILALGTILGLMFRSNTLERSTITTITAPLGSKSVVDLPDGTKVWINAGSKISYNNQYGKTNRDLDLIGEAYFSVQKNAEVPFRVKTSDIIVKALGTRFNVKAYPNEKTITATLEEGKISITSVNRTIELKDAELKPKQMITYIRKSDVKEAGKTEINKVITAKEADPLPQANVSSEVRTELITSWKDDTWIIEGEPLGSLAPVLERRYNVKIRFDSEKIKQYKFTGKIQNETIEQIMAAMVLSAPINFQMDNNYISLQLNTNLLDKFRKNVN